MSNLIPHDRPAIDSLWENEFHPNRGSVDWRGQPVKRPYSWERDVTVCIAAICHDILDPKIVFCTDNRIRNALGSSDQAIKDHGIGNRWRCLTAGTQSDYLALLRLYRKRFADAQNVTSDTIDASVKWPLHQRKLDLAEDYIRNRLAISYEEFLRTGKEKLPSDVFYDVTRYVRNIELGADLILAGFIDGSPELYETDKSGVTKAMNDFAIVGDGEYLASSVLLRRQQHMYKSLNETIYNVFEAKKTAEAVGSIGRYTHIAVQSADGKRAYITTALGNELDSLYRDYGPKDVPSNLTFTNAPWAPPEYDD